MGFQYNKDEIKEQYNLNNPCDKMKELTKKEKGRIRYKNKHKGKNKENKYIDEKGRILVEENKIESSLHSIFILMSLSFYKFDKSNYNIIFYIIQSFFLCRS